MDPAADLAGRTCLVTGASAGIGKEIARGLARAGARVLLACRNREKGEAVRLELVDSTRNPDVHLRVVELSSQASIREFAAHCEAREQRLHVLVNNAGVWLQKRQLGPDGIELTWATNVLGYTLLTELLLPLLRRSAPARIVNVASAMAHGLDLHDVQFQSRRYKGADAYAQSKQANRMWTWALARRLDGSGLTANALHPGGVATEIFKKSGGLLGLALSVYARLRFKTPEQGADTALWLATSRELAGLSGRFWANRRERACSFRNPEAEERLFSLCASMTSATH
jgi:NAD(P)-dependent dehydrogenase (short-subunit alcohol dehydrogenase family)